MCKKVLEVRDKLVERENMWRVDTVEVKYYCNKMPKQSQGSRESMKEIYKVRFYGADVVPGKYILNYTKDGKFKEVLPMLRPCF